MGTALKARVDQFERRFPDFEFRFACSTDRATIYDNLQDISGLVLETQPEVW